MAGMTGMCRSHVSPAAIHDKRQSTPGDAAFGHFRGPTAMLNKAIEGNANE
jgi:hypothetical protein